MDPYDSLESFVPPPKKQKPMGDPQQLRGADSRTKAPKVLLKTSEFPVNNLEDFYKPCPSYRLPLEIGAFSLSGEGKCSLDRSQLRYYTPPSRLNLDLGVGFNSFVSAKKNVPSKGLRPILRWIGSNGDSFRPKVHPKSPDKNGEVANSSSSSGLQRPDNLLTNFVSWRGMLTKLLCSPYNKQEPWRMAVTLHNGTIYFSEIETEESRERTAKQTPREQQMCYWGVKFEDYMTSSEPQTSGKAPPTEDKTGTVNDQRGFCSVVRTRMNTHSIVMAGEVDCYDHMYKEKPPLSYVELKTSRILYTDRNKASFRRYKLMKWWAQSFLVGVPKIVCGFRDDDGVVKSLQTFKTADIPRETQTDLSLWQPSVCLNFLDELLTWIRKTVVKDNPRVVYLVEWTEPYTCVSCRECSFDSEYVFLPNWYLNKQIPPEE